MVKSITLIQIDIETCSNTYGTSPCTAAIDVDNPDKCFNCRKTCQDIDNFGQQFTTLTFAEPSSYLPEKFNAIPCIENVSFTPANVSLGKDLGQRAKLSVTMKDHKRNDVGDGFDPYYSERSYDSYEQGTMFGKFRARQPFIRGKKIRLLRGFVGDDIADFKTWHFIIDSFDGPTPNGKFTITGKDVLKIADGERAQAPVLSGGFLVSTISSSATSFNVSPSGIGDTDYPASGLVAIGGNEIVSFTRSGDAFTIVRGQEDTEAVEHEADARVQLCLQYAAQTPAAIIRDLLVNYADIDSSYIDLSTWETETDSFLGSVYSAIIAEPTAVKTLVSEIIEQSASSLFWEPLEEKIKFKILRNISTDADTFDNDKILIGSLSTREQPDKRISQVWVYFAKTNPLLPLDEAESYRSTVKTIDAEAQTEYDTDVIKKIFSRWVPQGGRSIASRISDIFLARFRDPPRKMTFNLFHTETIVLGDGYQLSAYPLQDVFGASALVPIQITSLNQEKSNYSVTAEEMLFGDLEPIDPNDHTIIIDSNTNNVNLKTLHDSLFPAETDDTVISVFVENGVIVGSDDNSQVAFDTGTGWNSNADIIIYVRGRIQGAGGRGGNNGGTGQAGGDALKVNSAVTFDFENSAGEIWSGGGGGGGATLFQGSSSGGGGGQGQVGGNGGTTNPAGVSSGASTAGSSESIGAGGFVSSGSSTARGGNGGAAGQSGNSGSGGAGGSASSGGAAGDAIDGVSNITFLNDGSKDVRGSQVN
jgi:hypothetical protein